MALQSTLYRFRIDLSDVDRGVYEHLDFRVAMHPSESETFLITRVIAYALNYQEGLQFSKGGLSDPEEPAMSAQNPNGGFSLWIEIGSPSAKKLHKANKSSDVVKVYTYKNPELLMEELIPAKVYQPERMQLFALKDSLLNPIIELLERDTSWNLIHNEGSLMIQIGEETIEGDVNSISLERLMK